MTTQQYQQQDVSNNQLNTYRDNYNLKYNEIINSIAVNKEGNFVCLGGKKALQIVDLDTLKNVKCFIQQSKWEVGVVDWNTQAPNLIASSSNHDASIWDINNKYPLLNQFVSHQRPISDLSWSLFDKDILATTSADSFVNLWDLRSPKRVMKLKALNSHILSGIQVKWNKFNSHVLASAHESNLMIWDLRKETTELNTTVHTTKVYGIDWSPHDPTEILTCSQDRTVKIWSYPNLQPKSIIPTSHPVLRAKYLPMGKGVVTISDRGENSIRMWNLNDLSIPVATFIGHTDCVRSFDFRVKNTQNEKDIQIVSWSKDQNLRLWKLENNVKAACGIEYTPTTTSPTSRPHSQSVSGADNTNIGGNIGVNSNSSNSGSSLTTGQADIAMSTGTGSGNTSNNSSNTNTSVNGGNNSSNSSSSSGSSNSGNNSGTNNSSSSGGSNTISSGNEKEAIESSYSILKQQDSDHMHHHHHHHQHQHLHHEEEFIGPKELEYELKVIQNKFIDKSLKIEQVNLAQRVCIVSCTVSNSKSLLNTSNSSSNGSNSMNNSSSSLSNSTEDDTFLQDSLSITSVQLRVTFPTLYPQNAFPRFEIIAHACTTSLSTNISIIQALNEVASSKAGKPCFEPCLIKLVSLVKKDVMDRAKGIIQSPMSPGIRGKDNYDQHMILPPGGMEDSFIMGESNGYDGYPPLSSNNSSNSNITRSRPISVNGLQDMLIQDYQQSGGSNNKNIPKFDLSFVNNNNNNSSNSNNNNNNNNNLNSSSKDNFSNNGNIPSPRSISGISSSNNNNNKFLQITSSNTTADKYSLSKSLEKQSIINYQQLQQQQQTNSNDKSPQTLSGSFKDSQGITSWAAAISSNIPADFSLSAHRNSLSISLTTQQQRQMETIPCPRLCGAVFGGNNRLICFWNNIGKGPVINIQAPRTYKDLLNIVNKPTLQTNNSNNNSSIINNNNSIISLTNAINNTSNTNSSSPIYDSPLGGAGAIQFDPPSKMSISSFGSSPTNFLLSPLATSQSSQTSNLSIKQHSPSITYQMKIIDTSPLTPINLYLAKNYILCGTIEEICKHNESVAKSVNRKDLVKLWSLLNMITDSKLFFGANGKSQHLRRSSKQDSFEESWTHHPMGRSFVLSLINHYTKIRDIQTITMIYCLLTLSAQKLTQSSSIANEVNITVQSPSHQYSQALTTTSSQDSSKSPHLLSPSHSNSNLISQTLGLSFGNLTQSINFDEFLPKVSQKLDHYHHSHHHQHSNGSHHLSHHHQHQHSHSTNGYDMSFCLLTPSHLKTYDQYLAIYSDWLLRWELLDKRAEIMKFISPQQQQTIDPTNQITVKPIQFQITCLKCQRQLVDNFCVSCKIYAFKCAICHISVRGLSSFCVQCGHGGHTDHMKGWFKKQTVCPTGCGCVCSMSNLASSLTNSSSNGSFSSNTNGLLPDPISSSISSMVIDTHFSP